MALCAAVEPIVEALHRCAGSGSLDLAATPAAALDCLGGGVDAGPCAAGQPDPGAGPGRTAAWAVLWMLCPPPAARQLEDLPAFGRCLGGAVSPSQMKKYYSSATAIFSVSGCARRKAELSADPDALSTEHVDPHPGPDDPTPGWRSLCTAGRRGAGSLGQPVVGRCCRSRGRGSASCIPHTKKSMASLLCYLRMNSGRAVSTLLPVSCAVMGPDAVPAPVYQLSNGRTVQLVGAVDRVKRTVPAGCRW